jgi:tetratricopeptide (TPR) repeat protein
LLALFPGLCGACAGPDATGRARALVREHREAEAAALLRARLRAQPSDIPARRLLIRVLAVSGDIPAARAEVVELAHRVLESDPTPYIELGHALELAHRYDEALDAYDEAAVRAPASAEGPREGGLRCASWGEAEPARWRLEEAVRRGARDAETWHALGIVRLHLGDLDGAENAYRAGAGAEPRRAENWLGLATVAVVRGDARKALDAYDEVLARRPQFVAAELGRAWALRKLGRVDEASRALDRAEELGAAAAVVARQRGALTVPPDSEAK